jgi:hypothetical protein
MVGQLAGKSFVYQLVPGLYHVMIRDANNCQVTLNAALEVYILTAVVDYSRFHALAKLMVQLTF